MVLAAAGSLVLPVGLVLARPENEPLPGFERSDGAAPTASRLGRPRPVGVLSSSGARSASHPVTTRAGPPIVAL